MIQVQALIKNYNERGADQFNLH